MSMNLHSKLQAVMFATFAGFKGSRELVAEVQAL